MAESFDEIVKVALSKIQTSSTLEDIEKAVSIAKTAADANKSKIDGENASRQIRLEKLKTWPTLLVPIVSVLTLLATIYIQSFQLRASNQQDESKQWREFLESIKGSSTTVISDITFASRLKSFQDSKRYGPQVSDLAKRLMANVANQNEFTDLFYLVFPSDGKLTINDMADISRGLARTKANAASQCTTVSQPLKNLPKQTGNAGVCSSLLKDSELNNYVGDAATAKDMIQARRDAFAIETETEFISRQITKLLPNRFQQQQSANTIDLSGVSLSYVNLTDVDFSNVNLTDATLATCNLTGSVIKPTQFDRLQLYGSNWWDASTISKSLLEELIKEQFPGYYPGEFIAGDLPLTKEYYQKKINDMCSTVNGCNQELQFNSNNIVMSPLPK